MDLKTFSSISQEECLHVYKQILANSDEHWDSAGMLAEKKKFGSAISFCITSTEELIKSLIILYDTKGFEIRKVKGIEVLFKHHDMRYLVACIYYIAGRLLTECLNDLEKALKNPAEINKYIERLKKEPEAVLNGIKRYIIIKFVVIRKEMEWFSKADIYRQRGLYSDYENELKSPANITEPEFNDVFKRLEIVRKTVKGVMKVLEKDATYPYDQAILALKNDNVYQNLESELLLIKRRKKKPFDFLR